MRVIKYKDILKVQGKDRMRNEMIELIKKGYVELHHVPEDIKFIKIPMEED